MTIKQIHITIEQGLQNIGAFEYSDMEHEEIDIAINTVVYNLIADSWKNNIFEANQFELDLFQKLKVNYSAIPTKIDIGYKITLPNAYLHLISDSSIVIAKKCTFKVIGNLTIGQYYIVEDDSILHDEVWYDKGVIFVARTEHVYGNVRKVIVSERTNRLTKSEKLNLILENKFTKSVLKSPVSELLGNDLYIYASDFEIAKVNIKYLKKPTSVNYLTNVGLIDFNNDAEQYIIQKTIQHLSIMIETGQQKIVNLKNEISNNN